MEYKDYYKILSVSKSATEDEIKKSYRKLARKYHPDVSKEADADQKFKDVAEAYEVLKDPEKRRLYDKYGKDWKEGKQREEFEKEYGQQFGGGTQGSEYTGYGGGGFDFGGGGGFSDFFESMFGGSGGRYSAYSEAFSQKGDDIQSSINIPIQDAYTGATRRISFSIQSVTPEGRIEHKNKTLNIKIPKGIKNGHTMRLAGQGSPGYGGGEPGDLYIKVEFEPDPIFKAEGSDVYANLPVAPWEAALGNSVTIPLPDGKSIKLKVPAGSSQGKKLRLKGKGIPSKTPGDLYAVINIVLPPADNDKAKKIYEEMKDLEFDPRANFNE